MMRRCICCKIAWNGVVVALVKRHREAHVYIVSVVCIECEHLSVISKIP
jgi:hypothetical protein